MSNKKTLFAKSVHNLILFRYMTYISLANKYRPQTFKEVVGQESIETTLMNAVKSGRVAPAYLFYGPRGCGKTTTARLLAKALNCQHGPTDEPCGECPQCKEIAASSDLDVLELDAASNTQVDKIREVILDTVSLAAGRDRYKIFILDEVHMLSKSSFNALLKTLEEPPSHVVFILATTEFNKVPLTITSRCQTFRFKPIDEKEIATHLLDLAGAENFELTDGAAQQIAKNAGGALRDALTILDRALSFSNGRVDEELIAKMLGLMPRDIIKETAFALVRKDEQKMHKIFETVKKEGFDTLSLLKDLKTAFGEIFYFTLGSGSAPFDGAEDIIKETSPSFIAAITRKLSKLYDEVKYSDTPALAAEVGLFTLMQATLDIENLISRLEALEKGEANEVIPSNSNNNQEAEKFETQTVEEPKKIEVKAEEPKQTNDSKPFDPITALHALKNALAESSPVLDDALQNAKVRFATPEKWIFELKDAFAQDSCQRKKKDFDNISAKLFNRKINFEFNYTAQTNPQNLTAAPVSPRYADVLKQTTSASSAQAKTHPQAALKEELISKEEPFSMQDFSVKDEVKAGAVTQNILNLFDGQIISTKDENA